MSSSEDRDRMEPDRVKSIAPVKNKAISPVQNKAVAPVQQKTTPSTAKER